MALRYELNWHYAPKYKAITNNKLRKLGNK